MLTSAQPSTRSQFAILVVSGLVVIAFLIATSDIQRESLWNDEAWTAWAVRSPYIRDTLQRVQADVHPPLYFLLLGVFGRFSGDSVLALRWPSALFGMVALASTYAVGKQLFDRRTGILALILLGSASFFVYYTREARMYTLLMALAALSTLLYARWRSRPTLWRTLFYGISVALLLYTHYAGALVIITHLLHAIIVQALSKTGQRLKWYTLPLPYIAAFVLYLPWLPIFLTQMRSNPNGPLAIPVPTDWATVAALVLILTGGSWGLFIAPFVPSRAIPRLRQYGSQILLLVLWLLVTPIGLLALNQWFAPVYQVRYAIAMLPAVALLLAYGLRHIHIPAWLRLGASNSRYLAAGVAAVLLLWLAVVQLTVYQELWPSKPAWETTIADMIEARQPLDATITDLAAYSPSAYYNRQLGLRRGLGLDLSWRLHTPAEVRSLVDKLQPSDSIWIALPVNTAKSWQVAAQLDRERGINYRSSLGNMVFYNFNQTGTGDLQFQFGDRIRLLGTLPSDQPLTVNTGGELCTELNLYTLTATDDSFSVGLHLVDITGNINAAQWDNGFSTHAAGETVSLTPCLPIPANTSPGAYHLELTVYNWETVERLAVLETGGDRPISWGDVVMMQPVEVLP